MLEKGTKNYKRISENKNESIKEKLGRCGRPGLGNFNTH